MHNLASKNDCVTKNANSADFNINHKTYKPMSMTHKMAAKVMFLATSMVAMATSARTSFALDDSDDRDALAMGNRSCFTFLAI